VRFEQSEQAPCTTCGWENALVRKRCRNCNASLVLHPDKTIDREARQDQAEGLRLEHALGVR
jgi:hypothetical protein